MGSQMLTSGVTLAQFLVTKILALIAGTERQLAPGVSSGSVT